MHVERRVLNRFAVCVCLRFARVLQVSGTCAICLGDYVRDDEVCLLPCLHMYHQEVKHNHDVCTTITCVRASCSSSGTFSCTFSRKCCVG